MEMVGQTFTANHGENGSIECANQHISTSTFKKCPWYGWLYHYSML